MASNIQSNTFMKSLVQASDLLGRRVSDQRPDLPDNLIFLHDADVRGDDLAFPVYEVSFWEQFQLVGFGDPRQTVGGKVEGQAQFPGPAGAPSTLHYAVRCPVVVGVVMGLLAGGYGGRVDELITSLADIWHALPFLLLALVVVSLFGGSLTVLMVVLAMVSWVGFVRTVRAEVFVVKTQDYVQMSIICGASTYHIFIRHLLPGVMHAILVVATLAIGGLILTEATLSFLGAGIPPPTPSWGLMVSEGRDYLTDAWWSSFWPGLAIFLTVMSLNFLGDWLRDFYDPKLRQLV